MVYDQDALPASAALMDRLLVYQVPVNLSEQRLAQMVAALDKAAQL